MLPDAAAITLDEQATGIVVLKIDIVESFTEGRTRVFLLPTYTARYILLFCIAFLNIVIVLYSLIVLCGMSPLAATWRLAHLVACLRRW